MAKKKSKEHKKGWRDGVKIGDIIDFSEDEMISIKKQRKFDEMVKDSWDWKIGMY